MVKSMTGFGMGKMSDDNYSFSVEIKTINHRYNDIVIRMPKHLNFLEEKIKTMIKSKINRGRIEVYIDLEYIGETDVDIKVNFQLAKTYKDKLNQLADELHIKDDIQLSHILPMPEIIHTENKKVQDDSLWSCLEEALEDALDDAIIMRKKEGMALKKDMEVLITNIEDLMTKIEKRAPMVVVEYRDKLKERIRELLDEDCDIDEERVNTELVFFADKSDITEEIVRFKSHIKQFTDNLGVNESVGRKLDFIIQEMNREVNTIGSKANDLYICKYVVDIKSELEKIREQVQNIE